MVRMLIISSVIVLLLSGCANKVYFGTSTRLGIDFSSDGAGIGYKNAQAAIVPPRNSGTEFSVLGSSDVDLSLSKIIINEEFATGIAAERLSQRQQLNNAAVSKPHGNLLFGSYTTASFIDVNFGATNPFQGATIGYKRATATVIPIVKDTLRSVYAKTIINSEQYEASNNPCGTKTGGVRFVQLFATGGAAIEVASLNKNSLEAVQSLDKSNKSSLCSRGQ